MLALLLLAAAPQPSVEFLGGRLDVGSYGRVGLGLDLQGQLGRSTNIVAYGPRLLEQPYAELELRREDTFGPVGSRIVATVAFFPPFFHFNGSSAQHIALRNLYAEGTFYGLSLWAGSRMYRGDDAYLLDLRPLDDLNTVGGGARIDFGQGTSIAAHVGLQRLDQPTQYQAVLDDNPLGYGAVSVTRLDRPRLIASFKAKHQLSLGDFGLQVALYGEGHQLPGGVRRDTTTGDETVLPADWGVLAGGQVSVTQPGRFLRVWARHAIGLAVYDPLSSPVTVANDRTTQGAHSTRVALALASDWGRFGLMAGAYFDLVRDAGVSQVSAQKYDEGAAVVRGQLSLHPNFGVATEASYQRRTYALLDAQGRLRTGQVAQLGVMPFFSPFGEGVFARPQLRLVYALSLRDDGARSFYAAADPFSQRSVEHYLGLSVEWWFNASNQPVR